MTKHTLLQQFMITRIVRWNYLRICWMTLQMYHPMDPLYIMDKIRNLSCIAWNRAGCLQDTGRIDIRSCTYYKWYTWVSTTAKSVRSPIALNSAAGPFSAENAATLFHALCFKWVKGTLLLDIPSTESFHFFVFMTWLEAKTVFRLQILFAPSLVTSTSWFMPAMPASKLQPFSIQSSTVSYTYRTSFYSIQPRSR